ncbi:MAG TPA: DUF4242 domain-containing protein [Candidatus Limnocylindrales bacterium]|nr:DUF4242 domain-containing protein [Candidatus Limnocylindrales bacterium]
MPRYVVERTFPGGVTIPANASGAEACLAVVNRNSELGVTWLQSYVSRDLETTYCIYDGPGPDAIREAARSNGLPVDRITEVRVLDPYFYLGGAGAPALPASRGEPS